MKRREKMSDYEPRIQEIKAKVLTINEGRKDDQGKYKPSLVPALALIEVAKVFTFGAQKYGANNWRGGMDWSRYLDAEDRHILTWKTGERFDKESGISNLAHAICNLMMLLESEILNLGTDDVNQQANK